MLRAPSCTRFVTRLWGLSTADLLVHFQHFWRCWILQVLPTKEDVLNGESCQSLLGALVIDNDATVQID